MLRLRVTRALDHPSVVAIACAATLALGLFFTLVWAPHPWGREGFDHYHELALELAAGHRFPTFEVPWGYAYFLAIFYRAFGDHPVVPLLVQVVLNTSVPVLTFMLARAWCDRRTAALAALVTGVCSFNTVYASTQSSDAVCTVIFLTAAIVFVRGLHRDHWGWFAIAGILAGVAAQFRPNLILIPFLLAAYMCAKQRSARRLAQAASLVGCAAVALMPWLVRNYRLTGLIIPTSVHGGVQLWYGSLQVGPYLASRAYNPRAIFETPVFEYTSLDTMPLRITAHTKGCAVGKPLRTSIVYWTNRRADKRRVDGRLDGGAATYSVPLDPGANVEYFDIESTWPAGGNPAVVAIQNAPFVYFISANHLGDQDTRGDFVDIFDLIRLVRHVTWGEPIALADRLARAGISDRDIERTTEILGDGFAIGKERPLVKAIEHDHNQARLILRDASTITIPRRWRDRITDVEFSGPLAIALMASPVPMTTLEDARSRQPQSDVCAQMENITVNDVFYLHEPHLMRRYFALAIDNIGRDPMAFVRASLYRALRVFVIIGTDDARTAQQFRSSRVVYALATLVTSVYLAAFVIGAVLSWRRGDDVLLPLLLIAYIPATIAPMLTNMRYAVTVQPITFIFIAALFTTLVDPQASRRARLEARRRVGT